VTNEADKSKKTGKGESDCSCPFCDAPVGNLGPLCKACGVTINRCSSCGRVLPKGEENCPDCDA
jgi:predicted amidophosphoribosyltransferase